MEIKSKGKPDRRLAKWICCALFAALTAACAQIAVPIGLPLTLQTLSVALTGYCLGPIFGSSSITVYLLLGAVGLPVFSGFTAGIGAFFGQNGGFLLGFLPLAFFCGIGSKLRLLPAAMLGVVGLIICYIIGFAQLSLLGGVSLYSWGAAAIVYILKDVLSVMIAMLISKKLKKTGIIP